jgi:hypothetical protein
MSNLSGRKLLLAALVALAAMPTPSLLACAACYGAKTDSPLADGMNWGIMSLLGVIVCVLGGIVGVGVYLARKAAGAAAATAAQPLTSTNQA